MTTSGMCTRNVEKILAQPPDLSPHLDLAVSALATAASQPDWQQLEVIDVLLRQHHLSQAIDESVHQQLLSSASSPRDRALALSTTLPHAGDWLNCVPSSALGLHLQDREFRCCLRYWLGIPLHSSPYTCPECRHTADEHGDHQVGCGGNGDRITRHNAIRDVLFSAALSAALAPSREAAGVVPDSLPTSFSPSGVRAAQQPWMSMSFLLYNNTPFTRHPILLATHSTLVFSASCPPIWLPAGLQGLSLCQ